MLDDDSPPSLSNPLEGLVGYHLRRAANAMLVDLARRIEPLGLTLTEMSVVQLIAANPGIRQSEIGKALAIKRANMAPIIAALEARGHVSRMALDGRSQGLNLTDSGEAVVRQLRIHVAENEAWLMRNAGSGAEARLIAQLRAIWA